MRLLNEAIAGLPEVQELLAAMDAGRCPMSVSGLSPVHRAMLTAALYETTKRPLLVLCADEGEAIRMAADLTALCEIAPLSLFAREWQLHDRVTVSHGWEQQRLGTLYRMLCDQASIVVATVDGMLQRTIPKDALRQAVIEIKLGQRYDLNELITTLLRAGYTRTERVEGAGQFAVRGGILDVYSPLAEPVRIEFFDDETDAIGTFDPVTQRRTENLKRVTILPAAEVLPDAAEGGREAFLERMEKACKTAEKKGQSTSAEILRSDANRLRERMSLGGMDRYLAACYSTAVTAADYLHEDTLVVLSENARISERVRAYLWELQEDTRPLLEDGTLCGAFATLTADAEVLREKLTEFPAVVLDSLPTSRCFLTPRALLSMNVRQLPSYGGSLETAAGDMQSYLDAGHGVLVLCGNETRGNNLIRLLQEKGITARPNFKGEALPRIGEAAVSLGAVSAGCVWPQLRLVILSEGQLTASVSGKKTRAKAVKDNSRQKLQSYTDLTPGDLVVHVHHGIGRFVGMERMRVDGAEKDYIKIAYAGNDSLYVPATQLDMVSKYIGTGGGEEAAEHTRLSHLGGTDWARAKSRAKAAAKDLAKGLIQLYAERQRRPGFAFSPDSPWQREFEDAFDYEETPDQLRAIEEIKHDMEQAAPMDRLLCGDVGYGKTEVALRAVMKCVLDGKQAAILVPTTVLAQQHYATAINRFRSFPLTIDTLSRFRTPAQKKKVLEDTASGKIDLLIGTHALLQKSVKFKDLGLLVVDEEQRFGVTHKEKLREMSRQVDTLTLTATPIPRTLNMAMSGIRDMSTIETPPQERQPVQTYVLEHDWGIVTDAIRREIARGGQVYYLHNRVDTIESCAGRLHQLLGDEFSIATAHGKMDERTLSDVMQRVSDGEIQVLVCTTIIETGIDISNVNTLIIEDADRLGLAQLHQIRGRIGRSARRAYAYLTYHQGKILSEVAEKRLTAIREYAEFGSGFRIAMRDLEIRGAGNLLGSEQSGYLSSVGYDMYLRLLEDAVLEAKGEKEQRREECAADLSVSAHLPEKYIPSAEERMDIYRRIAHLRTEDDARDVLDELMDRYGDPPKAVLALMDIALLRTQAAAVGVCEITQRGDTVTFAFGAVVPVEALMQLCSMPKNRQRLSLAAGTQAKLQLHLRRGEDILESALTLVNELKINQKAEISAEEKENET